MQSNWEEIAQQAEKHHWTYPQYLATLCDKEVAVKEQYRIQKHIQEAKLPIGKTLDTFEFGKLASINAAQISALAIMPPIVKTKNNLFIRMS
jgi:DNA replication protein